jgi:hypothetical protein
MPVRQQFFGRFPSEAAISEHLAVYLAQFQDGCDCVSTYRPLGQEMGISAELLSLSRADYYESDLSSSSAWENLVQWARRRLKSEGYLAPAPRGWWRLSETGKLYAHQLIARRGRR